MESSLSLEFKRKGLHLIALIIPMGLFYFPENISLPLLFSVTAAAVIVEAGRGSFPGLQRLFLKFFSPLLRGHEQTAWTGSTFLLLASSLCALGFLLAARGDGLVREARLALYYGLAFLILGDAAAAIFGKTFGRHRLAHGKTLEGALACVITCLAWYALSRLWLSASIGFALALCAAVLTAVLEVLPFRLDDNLRVAPACCLLIFLALKQGTLA